MRKVDDYITNYIYQSVYLEFTYLSTVVVASEGCNAPSKISENTRHRISSIRLISENMVLRVMGKTNAL